MRRKMRRFSVGGGLVLLCVLLAMTACSRSKSSGPPDEGEGGGETPVAGVQTDEDATNATAQALIDITTAQAQTPQPEESALPTPQPTAVPAEATPAEATPPSVDPTKPTKVVEEPKATAESTAEPTKQAPETSGATSHTVQEGERLYRIALQYGLTYQELAAYNGIANPNLILVGQVLKLPAAGEKVPASSSGGGSHTVQAGENLFRIALRYGMTYEKLAAANGLSHPFTIYPGQKLIIP